jgi:hypothetical protein
LQVSTAFGTSFLAGSIIQTSHTKIKSFSKSFLLMVDVCKADDKFTLPQ